MKYRSTWLCPTPFDRARLLDMEKRITKARGLMFGAMGIALIAAIPWVGWWTMIPLGWVLVFYPLVQPWIKRSPRPEYPIALTVVNAQLMLGIAIAITGGPSSPALPFLMLVVVTLPARFTGRGVGAGVVSTIVVMLAASVGADPAAFADNPLYVMASLACLVGLAAFSWTLMSSERSQCEHAAVDQLTGLMNRKALSERFAELAAQAAIEESWVTLIACDLDHFKAVNDEHGHDRGDAVLREAAAAIKCDLRAGELAFRLGGEEFLIVLPGVTESEAATVAERVRIGLQAAYPAGLRITASFGVAGAQGAAVDYAALYARADSALYQAKRGGRNRVVADDAQPLRAVEAV
jgi:diguanylate cyclase (GGDEF)-like protein